MRKQLTAALAPGPRANHVTQNTPETAYFWWRIWWRVLAPSSDLLCSFASACPEFLPRIEQCELL